MCLRMSVATRSTIGRAATPGCKKQKARKRPNAFGREKGDLTAACGFRGIPISTQISRSGMAVNERPGRTAGLAGYFLRTAPVWDLVDCRPSSARPTELERLDARPCCHTTAFERAFPGQTRVVVGYNSRVGLTRLHTTIVQRCVGHQSTKPESSPNSHDTSNSAGCSHIARRL
jgi:hypothetical protein